MNQSTLDELRHLSRNIDICHSAAQKFCENPGAVIEFECFNRSEAQWFERFMEYRYPRVKFFTTWIFNDQPQPEM